MVGRNLNQIGMCQGVHLGRSKRRSWRLTVDRGFLPGCKYERRPPHAANTPNSCALPHQIASIPEAAVILVALSPRNSYVVTCTKPVKDAAGQPGNNLKVGSGNGLRPGLQKAVSPP